MFWGKRADWWWICRVANGNKLGLGEVVADDRLLWLHKLVHCLEVPWESQLPVKIGTYPTLYLIWFSGEVASQLPRERFYSTKLWVPKKYHSLRGELFVKAATSIIGVQQDPNLFFRLSHSVFKHTFKNCVTCRRYSKLAIMATATQSGGGANANATFRVRSLAPNS